MNVLAKQNIPPLSSITNPVDGLRKNVFTAFQTLLYHIQTLYLFTESDIKTVLIPITPFGVVAAPKPQPLNIIHAAFWLWMHILQFDVSNQTLSLEEDQQNKGYRPLPSGRISLRNALVFRWTLVPMCFALSLCYSVETLYVSIIFAALTIFYNEMGAHSRHWLVRNTVNALGYGAFSAGTALVANKDRSSLDRVGVIALWCDIGIIVTTIHTQDFKDVVGDIAIGRQTLPIIYPEFARLTVPVVLTSWSLLSWYIWRLDSVSAAVFIALAVMTGTRFLRLRSVLDDKITFYYWYNTWLTVVHALPGYYRYIQMK